MVDALRILFTGVVSLAWASNFDWVGWRAGARELPADHATIARQAITGDQTKALSDIAVSDKAVNKFRLRFPELYSRYITVIRGLQYSIRTEKTYLFRVARFVLHSRFTTADEIQPDKIAPYLEHLAVNRDVAPPHGTLSHLTVIHLVPPRCVVRHLNRLAIPAPLALLDGHIDAPKCN